jgi:putative membrane protein
MQRFQTSPIAAVAATLALFIAGANAQTGAGARGAAAVPTAPSVQPGGGARNSPTDDKSTKLDRADRKFIEKAASDSMLEVEAAKLATRKASSHEVKRFASTLVADHTKANSELAQLASAKGVDLRIATHGGSREIEKLGELPGDKFDQAFMKKFGVDDHKKDVKEYEKESRKAKDPELKAWVDKTLPTLRTHLEAANRLTRKEKGKS